MLSFGVSVAVNNLLALKAFHTFLFNYQFHEKPSWLERQWLPRLKGWVEKKMFSTLSNLLIDPSAKTASISLNDVSADFFAVLCIVQHPETLGENIKTGQDLVVLLSQMTLEFVKLQKPQQNVSHEPGL